MTLAFAVSFVKWTLLSILHCGCFVDLGSLWSYHKIRGLGEREDLELTWAHSQSTITSPGPTRDFLACCEIKMVGACFDCIHELEVDRW